MERLKQWAGTRRLTLDGLLCGLLHDALEQCPEFIPAIFPEQWKESIRSDWRVRLLFQFSQEDIRAAFNQLLHHKELYENYLLYFFIDGLDECLETCQEDYYDVGDLLLGWIDLAPLDLKLCVSSRNYEVFRTAFDDGMRLQLHELTRSDIANLVIYRLEGFEICSDTKTAVTGQHIERLLWLESSPSFGMTPMTLLRYTFLFDYEIDSNFAMRAEMRGYDLSEADVAIRKVQAQARLNDQSRGHLSTKLADIGYVTFIHRSVYDFLQMHHKTHIREACEGFNIVDAMSQMVLAEIKFFGLCSVHSTRLRWLLLKDLPQLLRLCQEEAKDASTFRFFDELDYAVLCAQGLNSLQDHPSQLQVCISKTGHFTPSACYFSVFHRAIYTQYIGYMRYKIAEDSRLVYDKFQFTHILACIIESIYDTDLPKAHTWKSPTSRDGSVPIF
ncbi:uncharacterized protein BDW43DRAFT_319651 [Aspergillus alliaceus]|uniref:uncharacterized protein n=1 Tax=Petromyces alliaceus TaxID=209559 RepID=UPI0012A5776D|nr:uncharacterized protein BDW43DRAFT_319651 [Aspergillus alliaceus]KAB8233373.1 hypothetical protein BDW43DRAFT_319651 [Aspergillus alliaceus]